MTKNQIAIDAIIVAAKIIIVSNNVEQNILYANSQSCIGAKYQRYPKKNYPEMDLMDKIEELELLET